MAFPTLIKPKFLFRILNNHNNFHLHIPQQHLLPLPQTLRTFVPSKIHACHQSQDHHQRQHALFLNSLPYRRQFHISGAAMSASEKLAVARKLAELKVDIIEAGFPASSKDNFKATELITKEVGNALDKSSFVPPVIAACGRCVREDVDKAWDAVKHAKHPRVVVFIPKTEISNKTKSEVLKMAAKMVAHARNLCKDVGFVCEDDGRADKELLYQVYGEAIKAGASTITFTDNFTNDESDMKANIPGIANADIRIHRHYDLNNALAADGSLKRKRTFQILSPSDRQSPVHSDRRASTDRFLVWSKTLGLNLTKRIVKASDKLQKVKSSVKKVISEFFQP